MTVLYTFSPPTDSWTGEYIDSNEFYGGSIADTYDIIAWAVADPPSNDYTSYCYLYKTASQAGWIHRFKCTFSLDVLPQEGEFRDIFALSLISGWWYSDPILLVNDEGKLGFEKIVDYIGTFGYGSANSITPGVTYELELYIDNRPTLANPLWQLYIDGDLWTEATDQEHWWWNPPINPAIWCGSSDYAQANQNATVTLHMENIVWTVEDAVELGHVYTYEVVEV